jgi:catechol 2,3-dioxygenase-like lactoylglutathione lyase family enzyme
MAKLRHIAMQVPDLDKAAAFYEGVFGLKRLKKVEAPIGNAISLSDGVVNLTLLHFPEGTKGGKGGPDWAGLHHFGFVRREFMLAKFSRALIQLICRSCSRPSSSWSLISKRLSRWG